MRLFYSNDDRLTFYIVFFSVISFFAGLLMGQVVPLAAVIVPAASTLGAAFFGVFGANALDNRRKRKQEIKENVKAANRVLNALLQRYRALLNIKQNYILPYTDGKPFKDRFAFTIEPPPEGIIWEPNIELVSLDLQFLIGKRYQQIFSDLHMIETDFHHTWGVFNSRNDYMNNIVYSAMKDAGFMHVEKTLAEYEETIPREVYRNNIVLTRSMCNGVEDGLVFIKGFIPKVHAAICEVLPKEVIFNVSFE